MIKKLSNYNFVDYLILIIFSFFINYFYANIGVLAQDTFAYYDTAYRILDGSVPFKDYWTVSGPFIDFLQALYFFIFGVNWKSYIINSSIINSLITIIFFYTIRNFKQDRLLSIFYALCFSVLANPSMGTPFPDHYSTFLSLMGIFLFLNAILEEKKIYWFLIPICFFFAFFSKQTPSSYILIVLLITTAIYILSSKKIYFLKYFVLSSISCLFLLLVFFYFYKIDLSQFIYQYIIFPKTIASERLENYQLSYNNIFFQFKFIYLFLIPLVIVTFFKLKNKNTYDSKFLYLIIIILVSMVLIFHQAITKNFIFIFFLIPILASLTQMFLKNSLKFRKIISIFLISTTFLLTIKYHLRFNDSRKMLNLERINLENYENSEKIHPSLKGLKWLTFEYNKDPLVEIELIKDSLEVIEKDKTKKMLLTRYLFFSSVLNENLNNPSRWPSTQDASNPDKNNPYFEVYRNFILNLIKSKKIETIYTSEKGQGDIFKDIFDKNCRKTKVINDFLIKHDIKSCINKT